MNDLKQEVGTDNITSQYEALLNNSPFDKNPIVIRSLTDNRIEDTKRIPERVFVGVFLPIFAGDKVLHYGQTMDLWLNVIGGPYKSAYVVDSQDKFLFEVPPLLNREAVNPINNAGTKFNLGHVVATFHQVAMQSPARGIHYLESELTKRALIMKVPGNVLKELEIWNAIFKRYGRPPIMELTPDQKRVLDRSSGATTEVPDVTFEVD